MSDIYKEWTQMPPDLQFDGHHVALCQLVAPHAGKWAIRLYVDNHDNPVVFDTVYYILPPCIGAALEWMRNQGARDARQKMREALGL